MVNKPNKNEARLRRHRRVRGKISGTASCPRLDVFRSNAHIYAQIIDDVAGVTLAAASSMDKDFEGNGIARLITSQRAWMYFLILRSAALTAACTAPAADPRAPALLSARRAWRPP